MLTVLGITIGVTGLYVLMSFGAGLRKISDKEFHAFDEFHAAHITSYTMPVNPFRIFSFSELEPDSGAAPVVPITDDLLGQIRQIPGVVVAFPDEFFLIRIRVNNRVFTTNCHPIPMQFEHIPRYQPVAGSFFTSPTDSSILISEEMARQFGFPDPESAIGEKLQLSIPILRVSGFQFSFFSFRGRIRNLPLVDEHFEVVVRGILPDKEQSPTSLSRISIPVNLFREVPKLTEDTLFGLFLQQPYIKGYPKIRVHINPEADPDPIYETIEQFGLHVTRFGEHFKSEQQTLMVLDIASFILGTIALFIAAIGMSNIMIVNVVERTQEIGILKAVGGEDSDVQRLFLFECGLMGSIGIILGLGLGWIVKSLITLAADYYFNLQGRMPITLFESSTVLVISVSVVALVITVTAGLIPARRASRIEPIKALRV